MRNGEDIELIKARPEKQLTRRILVFTEANNVLLVNYDGFDFQYGVQTVTSIIICTSVKVDTVPLPISYVNIHFLGAFQRLFTFYGGRVYSFFIF